jgi:hypothetical protein
LPHICAHVNTYIQAEECVSSAQQEVSSLEETLKDLLLREANIKRRASADFTSLVHEARADMIRKYSIQRYHKLINLHRNRAVINGWRRPWDSNIAKSGDSGLYLYWAKKAGLHAAHRHEKPSNKVLFAHLPEDPDELSTLNEQAQRNKPLWLRYSFDDTEDMSKWSEPFYDKWLAYKK